MTKKPSLGGANPSNDYQPDSLDLQILSCLMEDANRPFTDIAQELMVSHGTIHVRMKKLREVGIVRGAHLSIDVRKLGFDITAFVGVILDKALGCENAVAYMEDIPEVVEVYYVTGAYSLLLKVICRDSGHLLQVLKEKVQMIEGVVRTETFILLDAGIRRPVQLD